MNRSACRSCGAPLHHVFADLGRTPIANAFRRPQDAAGAESIYPLKAFVCDACWLVQIEDFHRPEELFREDYAYFSSYSDSWLAHAASYAKQMTADFGLDAASLVVEVASNDGYLLQHFKARGIPVLGVEPAASVAEAARRNHGIDTLQAFFGADLASRLRRQGLAADLLVANNVLAHVPDINDFVAGFAILLKPDGLATFEFPHLLNLMRLTQFDTIYHEHYSYLSLLAVEALLARHGLKVVDIAELPTHGGSLRLFVRHAAHDYPPSAALTAVRARETHFGLDRLATYRTFDQQVRAAKRAFLRFLIDAKEAGASIAAYGAPAKGNTLLNYCGVGRDFIDYTVDRNPQKQGMLLPGTAIPVHAPDHLFATRPDYVVILPWNLKNEIVGQMAAIRHWGGRFVVPMPCVEVL
jgi:SAM-dependent methyltransferase